MSKADPAAKPAPRHICPVCELGLDYPPADYNICPQCGTEFGAEDMTYAELRENWIANGRQWWSRTEWRRDD